MRRIDLTTGTQRGHRTRLAALRAAESELCNRGYKIFNKTPHADFMAVSPERNEFFVDVKGLYRKNPWIIRRKEQRDDLYIIFAFVPDNEPNQFFVMSQQQANKLVKDELIRLRRSTDYPVLAVVWKLIAFHKNCWDTLSR